MNDLNQAVFALFALSFVYLMMFAFISFGILKRLFNWLSKKIRFPKKVKTQDGFLYRADNGVYVSKSELEYVNVAHNFKNKDRWIKHFERRIEILKTDQAQLKERYKDHFEDGEYLE